MSMLLGTIFAKPLLLRLRSLNLLFLTMNIAIEEPEFYEDGKHPVGSGVPLYKLVPGYPTPSFGVRSMLPS